MIQLFITNYNLLLEQVIEELFFVPILMTFRVIERYFFDLQTVEKEQFLNLHWMWLWKIHGLINRSLINNGKMVGRSFERS